ncbi:MAG: bifunctional phosphopantothenoylcysteine decarboxylase/phosphopantothenate--cysteine ligase CoaBC [Legionellaceae bacterium]|nr:bifunctional phosphopantothenoylcysteine decarboxylase/phosphopantothenate--cysteine ligase CoaBC [Legionellaceae bacterium]
MQDFKDKKIVLGITGGIAAYKSTYLIRELKNLGAQVRVVLTQSAKEFVSALTLQALSGEDVRCETFDHKAEKAMSHIELARWADYLLIAPASANFLAKMTHGIADDLLSTIYLVANTPVIVCPAMNKSMWEHPATKDNCKTLISRGVQVVGPNIGIQACGEYGLGRLCEYNQIINALRLNHIKGALSGHNILLTAGPTQESIDPVRCITNHSSGKMGYALAEAALFAGAQVTLISGPTTIQAPEGVTLIPVTSANEMLEAVLDKLQKDMLFIGTAAVADYSLANPSKQKLKKEDSQELSLKLIKNPDIIKEVVATNKSALNIGFAAETENVIENASKKLHSKKLDMIVANKVGGNIGFNSDKNQVTLITTKNTVNLELNHKINIAGEIILAISKMVKNS